MDGILLNSKKDYFREHYEHYKRRSISTISLGQRCCCTNGKAFTEEADYTKVATDHVDSLYAYGTTDVLFKPTVPLRSNGGTKESCCILLVATNGVCKEDKGFALQPWTNVRV